MVFKSSVLVFSLASTFLLGSEAKSIDSLSTCGNPDLKDSWTVEIHVKNKAVEAFCYGVLISPKHVLTSHECLWTRKDFLGSHPVAKFPYLSEQPSINFKLSWQSNWAGSQDQYGLALFELEQSLSAASSNFTPICLPPTTPPTASNEAAAEIANCQLCPVQEDSQDCIDNEARIPGFAYTDLVDGKFFLRGLRVNTCPSLGQVLYLPLQSSFRWLEAALIESEATHPFNDLVNGLCPHVTRWEIESCYKAGSLPGRITGLSKVKCDSWKLFKSADKDNVQVQCNEVEGDGEILTLALSQVSCRVVDCSRDEATDEAEAGWIPLSRLGDCMEATIEGLGGCDRLENYTTQEVEDLPDTTLSPFFGTRSAIVFNEAAVVEEAAAAEAAFEDFPASTLQRIDRCPTQDSQQTCKFPFYYQKRLHFECVTRDTERGPECQTDRERWGKCSLECPLMKYHDHEQLMDDLEVLQKATPSDVSLFSLGKSIGGRELRGVRLHKATNTSDEDDLRPLVKLVGNMHGNEPTGRELLIHLAKYIVMADRYSPKQSKSDPMVKRAAQIMQNTDLWILPTMNPDGFARGSEGKCFGGNYAAGRTNEGRRDLNRDFPSWRQKGQTLSALKSGKQHETQLVMEWILKHPFVLSANFHDGAVLANYPYDDYRSSQSRRRGGVSATPDHDVFVHLAKTYASNHPYMEDTSKVCEHWGFFKHGITNGADWYEVRGGMQDFNYDFSNAMEITVEVSCCKYPDRKRLLKEWENNLGSLISYVEQAQRGLRGYVKDENDNVVERADIQVQKVGEEADWRGKNVTSDSRGRYWRILLPGTYIVRAVKGSNISPERTVQITSPQYLRVDFQISQ